MKVIGLYTEDFRFFYQVVRLLKQRGEPFVSLGREGKVPASVGVVITTEAERDRVRFGKVVAQAEPEEAINMARCLLMGGNRYQTVVVGIDPGKKVGLAIFGEGKLLATETVKQTEAVPGAISKLLRCLSYARAVARVGHGDPTRGSRIIRGIWDMFDQVELVDETGTTVRAEEPDVEAAKRIAMSSGDRLEAPPPVDPTEGEVRDIQRLSRLESQGSVTISADLARSVARGDRTLSQAVGEQRRRERKVRPGGG